MAKKSTVTWYEALNEQVEWSDSAAMLHWLADVFGRRLEPSRNCTDNFGASLRRMRLQLGDLHFERSADLSWLNKELKQCQPQLRLENAPKSKSRLPAYCSAIDIHSHEAPAGNPEAPADDKSLEQLRLTLLLQFADFIGGTIDSGMTDAARIDRCRGLYREDSEIPLAAAFPAQIENKWRNEIELLVEHENSADDIIRCEYFFPRTPKGRFCSDACRFSTFQIAKQLQEPNYLADKQKRYRSSKKQ